MYGIFTYIYNKFKPNVGKYTVHMEHMRNGNVVIDFTIPPVAPGSWPSDFPIWIDLRSRVGGKPTVYCLKWSRKCHVHYSLVRDLT